MTHSGSSLPSFLILHGYTDAWSTKLDMYDEFVVDFDDKTTMKLAETDNRLSCIV